MTAATHSIRRGSIIWLTMTALFMGMNIVLSMSIFSVPVPGGHLYFCDAVINTAAVLLDPFAAFLVGGVGAGMLGSAALGWRLLLGQLLTQLTLLVATRRLWRDRLQPVEPLPEEAEASPVRSAVLVALTVCGYMALFGALTGALRAWIGRGASNALLCLLDVPSGARLLAASGVEARIVLPLLAGMCGFGGICVAAQNLRALKGCGIPAGEYLAARLLAAGLCAGFVALMARFDGLGRLPFDAVRQNPLAAAALVACALSVPVLVKMRKSIS